MAIFYFNVRTHLVEELERKSQSKDLLGPYDSRAAAERALALADERTQAWDDEAARED